MVRPELRAEDFSSDELRYYEPVGETAGRYTRLFNQYLEVLPKIDKPKLIVLEGHYGMGKTLLVRRSLIHAVSLYQQVLPVYIPVRRLGMEDPRKFDELREKYKIKDPSPITYVLIYWREICEDFLGRDPWNIEITINNRVVKRIDILNNIIEQNPKDIVTLIKIVNENYLQSVVAVDEFEGFILRDTRDRELVRKLQPYIVGGIIVGIYGWLTGSVRGRALVVLASALGFESDEWLRLPLQELARYPASAGLRELLTILRIPSTEIDRITTATTAIAEEEIEKICKRYESSLPFRNPSVAQTLKPFYVKLRYKAEDYEKVFERFSINVVHKDLPRIFELVELTMRTAVGLAKRMLSMSISELMYETLARVLDEGADRCYKVDGELKYRRKLPSHTKAITRICNLLKEGVIAVDRDVALSLYYEKLSEEERVKLQAQFRQNLCKALMIEGQCDPWNPRTINKIIQTLNQLRLEWRLVKLVSIPSGPEYYAIDEALLRWALGDSFDLLGNYFDLRTYLESIIDERRKGSRSEIK